MQKDHYVLLLAGGLGTRLWPLSRANKPKQFLDVLNVGKTLIQLTYERYATFIPKEQIFVVTHKHFESLVKEQLPEIAPENILLEPVLKNTVASVIYGAMKLYTLNKDANIVISPCDQLILEPALFENDILNGLTFTQQMKALITVGVRPSYPNTNYGYIQHASVEAVPGIYQVKTFTEKPDLSIAQMFLDSGDFLWNSGIFIWRAKYMLENLKKHLPEEYEMFDTIKETFNTPQEEENIKVVYPFCPNMSMDTFVLEKLQHVYVIPASFGWTDIGNWLSVYENVDKDYLGNSTTGKNTMIVDAEHCIINTDSKKLAVIQGVKHMIIIDTNDVLLICQKEKENEMKDYIAEVKRSYDEKFL